VNQLFSASAGILRLTLRSKLKLPDQIKTYLQRIKGGAITMPGNGKIATAKWGRKARWAPLWEWNSLHWLSGMGLHGL